MCFLVFFFNDTATTEIYTLSLHDALPISKLFIPKGDAAYDALKPMISSDRLNIKQIRAHWDEILRFASSIKQDRKSTRLNSSHQIISYAVFCLKKKKTPSNPIVYSQSHRH